MKQRQSGKIGQAVHILGQGFVGTTSVLLNNAPATFTVDSNTSLIAIVPTGSTTGNVEVTTPRGHLTSNASFQIKAESESQW